MKVMAWAIYMNICAQPHPPNLAIILIHKNKVVAVILIFSTFQNWNEVASIAVNRADYFM